VHTYLEERQTFSDASRENVVQRSRCSDYAKGETTEVKIPLLLEKS
jgi:hypothetical protein